MKSRRSLELRSIGKMVGESILEGFRSSRALRSQSSIPGHLRKKIGFQELVKGNSEPFARAPSMESRRSVELRSRGKMVGTPLPRKVFFNIAYVGLI